MIFIIEIIILFVLIFTVVRYFYYVGYRNGVRDENKFWEDQIKEATNRGFDKW